MAPIRENSGKEYRGQWAKGRSGATMTTKKPAKRGNRSQADRLAPRAERFVAEYLISLNATAAAKKAGYSARTARQQGARLLTNVSIAAAIQAGQAAALERAKLKLDDV